MGWASGEGGTGGIVNIGLRSLTLWWYYRNFVEPLYLVFSVVGFLMQSTFCCVF